MNTICLTDAPEVVRLKAEFRRLDARHEVVKDWPAGAARAAELVRLSESKKELAARVFESSVAADETETL